MSGAGVKVPQLYALQLERLIARGLPAARIVQLLRAGSEEELAALVDPEVKWERLLTYARDNLETVEAAVQGGYAFPFITIGGIMSLLDIKFGKREGTDYRFPGDRIEGLRLNGAEADLLRSMLPAYWEMSRTGANLPEDQAELSIALREPPEPAAG
ncbi:hypothetical protein [Paenibacillus glycinis]|uniref:hypothetical protein n=1 Tax=Paenibacillus glycinis TaxID=2697035 RepID=UPI0013786F7D|nr:hypothetical protein [Paenibacillus glycinis]